MVYLTTLLFFFGIFLNTIFALETGKVTGILTIDEKKIPLQYVYAETEKDPFDEKKKRVVVYISDVKISPEQFENFQKIFDMVITGKLSMVKIVVNDKKEVATIAVYQQSFGSGGIQLSGVTKVDFQSKKYTSKDIEGSIIRKISKDFNKTWSVNATFKTPINDKVAVRENAIANATKLPSDGGIQGKIYREYYKAIEDADMKKLRMLVVAEQVAQMDDPKFKEMFPMIQSMQPKKIKILGGLLLSANQAILNIEGTSEKETSEGTIEMVVENNQWKVKRESWKSK